MATNAQVQGLQQKAKEAIITLNQATAIQIAEQAASEMDAADLVDDEKAAYSGPTRRVAGAGRPIPPWESLRPARRPLPLSLAGRDPRPRRGWGL